MVKRLRRCPLKAKSGVRFPLEVPPRDSDIDTISESFLLHFFEIDMQIWGISSWNWCLAGENCKISFLWIKCSICFQTDSRQNRSLVYSRRLFWPQFCTPLSRKRGKRTQCYDIMRTQCTLLSWGFGAAIMIGGYRNRLLKFNKVVYSREESEYSAFRHLSSMENSRDVQIRGDTLTLCLERFWIHVQMLSAPCSGDSWNCAFGRRTALCTGLWRYRK